MAGGETCLPGSAFSCILQARTRDCAAIRFADSLIHCSLNCRSWSARMHSGHAKITPLAAKRFVGRLSRPVLTNDVVRCKPGKLLRCECCNTQFHHLPFMIQPPAIAGAAPELERGRLLRTDHRSKVPCSDACSQRHDRLKARSLRASDPRALAAACPGQE